MEKRCGGRVVLSSELEPGPSPSTFFFPAEGYVTEQRGGDRKKRRGEMGKGEQNLGFRLGTYAGAHSCTYVGKLLDIPCTSYSEEGHLLHSSPAPEQEDCRCAHSPWSFPCVFGPLVDLSTFSYAPCTLGQTLRFKSGCKIAANIGMPTPERGVFLMSPFKVCIDIEGPSKNAVGILMS